MEIEFVCCHLEVDAHIEYMVILCLQSLFARFVEDQNFFSTDHHPSLNIYLNQNSL